MEPPGFSHEMSRRWMSGGKGSRQTEGAWAARRRRDRAVPEADPEGLAEGAAGEGGASSGNHAPPIPGPAASTVPR